jgi:hypothetical protein
MVTISWHLVDSHFLRTFFVNRPSHIQAKMYADKRTNCDMTYKNVQSCILYVR